MLIYLEDNNRHGVISENYVSENSHAYKLTVGIGLKMATSNYSEFEERQKKRCRCLILINYVWCVL